MRIIHWFQHWYTQETVFVGEGSSCGIASRVAICLFIFPVDGRGRYPALRGGAVFLPSRE